VTTHAHPRGIGETFDLARELGAEPRALYTGGPVPWAIRYGNYFNLGGHWLIMRVSRSSRPFWGLRLSAVQLFRDEDFSLLLLTSSSAGWCIPARQVHALIRDRRWRLAKDLEFKINLPLPENRRFGSSDELRARLGIPHAATA
jgi:hypothetical protein